MDGHRSQVFQGGIVFLAVLALGGCAGRGSRRLGPSVDIHKEVRVCGVKLPCTVGGVVHRHDYHSFFRARTAGYGRIIVNPDPTDRGCVRCVNPSKFFRSLLSDPAGRGRALLHIIYAVAGAGRRSAIRTRPTFDTRAWSRVYQRTGKTLREAARKGLPVSCHLLSAHCASTPGFRAAFRRFLPRILMNPPRHGDPGFAKEFSVKLAVFLDPKGSFPALSRFIRSGARVRARMKAVRDLCTYVGHPKVSKLLRWVEARDPGLRRRAQKCLRRPLW